jgi:NAD(P)H-hydrate epimerase
MNPRPLSRDEVRAIDRRAIAEFGVSGLVLMENAGRGCADVLCRLGCRGPIALCCGKGNNGGDGFVIARHLDRRGIAVRVLLLADPAGLRGDAAANHAILARSDVPIDAFSKPFDENRFERQLAGVEWIVDALLGTGATGEPREPFARALEIMNAAPARKLAIDLPSGLDCDSGQPAAVTFRAEQTCTFVAAKLGFSNAAAQPYLGQVHILDIGAPRKLIESVRRSASA